MDERVCAPSVCYSMTLHCTEYDCSRIAAILVQPTDDWPLVTEDDVRRAASDIGWRVAGPYNATCPPCREGL